MRPRRFAPRSRLADLCSSCRRPFALQGRDALAALAETPFDVVLCDLRMPGMTGIEVWEQVRASACVPPAAVLMTAAVEGSRLAAQHGMAFLEKPFNFETLRATIDAAIATRGPPVR